MKSTKAQLRAAKRYREKKKRDKKDLKEALTVLGQIEDYKGK